MTLKWRQGTQQPDTNEPITALVAYKYDTEYLIGSIYIWRTSIGWRHERMSTPPPTPEFAWIPEDEILATITQ